MAFQHTEDVKGSTSQPLNPIREIIQYYTGLKLDKHDHRDFEKVYGAPHISSADEHPVVDLRKYVRQVYAQGKMNSCGANVICSAYELELNKQAEEAGLPYYNFHCSRLFVYFNARRYEKNLKVDDGASIRDTLRGMVVAGACKESLWPYNVQNVLTPPPMNCYHSAVGNRIKRYEYLNHDLNQFRACLKDGFPIAFGFKIYKSFLITKNQGFMPVPSDEEIQNTSEPELHGVLAVGYNDNLKHIIVLNSWGESYGDKGYFYMPYKVITDSKLTFNFWKIGEVSHGEVRPNISKPVKPVKVTDL